jgi:hypothetical protein
MRLVIVALVREVDSAEQAEEQQCKLPLIVERELTVKLVELGPFVSTPLRRPDSSCRLPRAARDKCNPAIDAKRIGILRFSWGAALAVSDPGRSAHSELESAMNTNAGSPAADMHWGFRALRPLEGGQSSLRGRADYGRGCRRP